MYADGYKRRCYPILVGLIVDYEEQVLITNSKANMQYTISHVPPKKRELVTRSRKSQTYQSTWTQLAHQCNNPAIQRNKAVDGWLHQ